MKKEEEELNNMNMSVITEVSFMSRLSQLQQRVSEAVWRYQLVLQDTVTKEFGSTILRPSLAESNHADDGYGMSFLWDDTECIFTGMESK